MPSPSTLVDRVKIFTTSSGTGPFTFGDAVPAFRGVEALTDGLIYSYAAENGADFEVGQGQFVAGTNQLVRTVFESSLGAGAPVPFPVNIAVNFTALAIDWENRADSTATEAAALAVAAAGAASSSADDSQESADASAASAVSAETAATAAQAAGHYAPDVAAGLATYPSGQYFFVPDAAGNLKLYLNNAGVAVDQNYAIPGAAAIEAINVAVATASPLDFVEGFDGVAWDTVAITGITTDAKVVYAYTAEGTAFFDLDPRAPAVADIKSLVHAETDVPIVYATETAERAVTLAEANRPDRISPATRATYYISKTGADTNQGIRIGVAKASFAGMLAGLPYLGVKDIFVAPGGSGGVNGSYWASMTSGTPYEMPTFSYEVIGGTVNGSVQSRNRIVRPGKFAIGSVAPTFAPVVTTGTPPVFTVTRFGKCYQPEDVVALVAGKTPSLWRETFLDPTMGMEITSEVRVGAQWAPTISGSDVLPPSAFSPSTHPSAGGVVYEFIEAMDTVNGGRTHNQGQSFLVWNDESPSNPTAMNLKPFTYVNTVALCAATPGTFYYDPAAFGSNLGTPAPIYVHPFGSTDPRSDGKTYVAPKRYGTFDTGLIDNLTLNGPHAHMCMVGNNGLYVGKNAVVKRQIVGFATSEHSYVVGGGLMEDCISYDGNGQTRAQLAASDTSAVFYTTDATGQSYEYRRFFGICPDRPGAVKAEMMLAHQGSGTEYTSGRYEACIGYRVGALTGVVQAADVEIIGCAGLGLTTRFGLVSPTAARISITHNYVTYSPAVSGVLLEAGSGTTAFSTLSFPITDNVFVQEGTSGTLLAAPQVMPGLTIDNNFFRFNGITSSVSLQSDMHPTASFKRNIVVCGASTAGPWQRALTARPTSAALIDYNVYIRVDGSNPVWWNRADTGANVTSFAAWKALGFDLHSVLLTQAEANDLFLNGFAGMMAGDLRLNPQCDLRWSGGDTSRIVDGPHAAGPREYYDHNKRMILAGAPAAPPTPPITWAECNAYILDPLAWDFYA